MKIVRDKQGRFFGFKASLGPPDDGQLAKINQFTKRPFTAEELYVGQMRLANNALDRDNERFSEMTLQGFHDSAVRKTLLLDHDRNVARSGIGKFFDVEMETMSPEAAKAATGVDFMLPQGVSEVKFVAPWFYIPKRGVSEQDLTRLEAGIFDWVSIGFGAEKLIPITDGQGTTLYHEYQGKGETREGSFVYLGAQYGAAAKSADNSPDENTSKEGKSMQKIIAFVGALLNKTLAPETTEDAVLAEVKTIVQEKDTRIAELTPLAADGKAYREDLVKTYVAAKAKLGEVAEAPEAQEGLKRVADGYPLEFLKNEVGHLQQRIEEKFPDKGQLPGDERRDKSGDGGKGVDENPLIPKEVK